MLALHRFRAGEMHFFRRKTFDDSNVTVSLFGIYPTINRTSLVEEKIASFETIDVKSDNKWGLECLYVRWQSSCHPASNPANLSQYKSSLLTSRRTLTITTHVIT